MFRAYLTQLIFDYLVFIENVRIPKFIMIIIYINDFLSFYLDVLKIKNLKQQLATNYIMKNLRSHNIFLYIKIKKDKKYCIIFILQKTFINKI